MFLFYPVFVEAAEVSSGKHPKGNIQEEDLVILSPNRRHSDIRKESMRGRGIESYTPITRCVPARYLVPRTVASNALVWILTNVIGACAVIRRRRVVSPPPHDII